MFAIIEAGGKQHWVEQDKFYDFNKISAKTGEKIIFNRVLLIKNGDDLLLGKPIIEDAVIEATVLGEVRGPKVKVYKMRSKKKTRRNAGFRQKLTRIKIETIKIK